MHREKRRAVQGTARVVDSGTSLCAEHFPSATWFGHDGTNPHRKHRALVIQFHEDHFTYDATRRGFFVDEPDTLLGDRITRVDVMQYRVSQGWQPLTTIKLDGQEPLGVIDVWTKTDVVNEGVAPGD